MDLSAKVAIVTGSGRGIGKAIALLFAEKGAHLAIVDRKGDTAQGTAAEIEGLGGRAVAIRADVTRKPEVDDMVRRVLDTFGGVDILVNNAGWLRWEPFIENTPELWDQMIDVNLKGTIFCSRAVLDHMMERRRGKIVNIASDVARTGAIGQSVYAAAKGGVISFSKCLALEMAQYHINVNCVAPWMTDTPLMRAGMERSPELARIFGEMEKAVPWGRMAKPEEIADAVLFLASSYSDFITGQVISVNGGAAMVD